MSNLALMHALLVVFAACRSPTTTCSDDHCYGPVFVFSNEPDFSQTPRRVADVISHGGEAGTGGLGGAGAVATGCGLRP